MWVTLLQEYVCLPERLVAVSGLWMPVSGIWIQPFVQKVSNFFLPKKKKKKNLSLESISSTLFPNSEAFMHGQQLGDRSNTSIFLKNVETAPQQLPKCWPFISIKWRDWGAQKSFLSPHYFPRFFSLKKKDEYKVPIWTQVFYLFFSSAGQDVIKNSVSLLAFLAVTLSHHTSIVLCGHVISQN